MSVILATQTVTTDKFAGLNLDGVTYTTASVSWTNTSSVNANFRIVGTDFTSEEITVAGSAVGTYVVTGMQPGSSNNFYLQRFEIDEWIQQTSSTTGLDYVAVTTFSTSMTISPGSSSASVVWTNPGVASSTVYTLTYTPTGGSPVTSTTTEDSMILSGLTDGIAHSIVLSVTENGTLYTLSSDNFTTSSNVAMVVEAGPFASYIDIDWEDSVAGSSINYRIVNRVNGNDDVIISETEATSASIRDLTPGTNYKFVLQRLEFDGSWSDQNELTTTTHTTSISIGSIGSETMMVSWAATYEGAIYELFYNGISAGETSDVSTALKGLQPNTAYELELTIRELGESVGLSTLGMSTNDKLLNNSNMIIMATVVLAIIVAVMMMRK